MACDDPYSQATYVQDSKPIPEQSRPASAPRVGRPSMSPHNDPSPPGASLIQATTAIPNNTSTDGGSGAQTQTQGTMHAPLPYQPEARVHPSSASPPSAQLSPTTTRSPSTAEYFSNGETRGGYDLSMFDLKAHASWYPHRWLSATGATGATTCVDEFAEYQSQSTSGGANSQIWQTWLPSGGWANQQAVIDRYDLPAPSFVHDFASEAAVGDTGSSISGAADVGLPPSSHHRYAGDLFHGRGTSGGYGGPLPFVFNEGQMSFGRAAVAMDLGGTNAGSADVGGRGVRPQDLTLNTMDEYPNMSMDELSASASEPLTVQASTPPPFPPQLPRQQIQPLSSASSSQHRLDALTEGLSLSSPPPQSPDPLSPPPMNATRSFSSTDGYPVSSSGRQQYGYGGSTNSHSRSMSQPPSEHRLPMGVRSATALNSPAQSPFELPNGNAGFSPLPFSGQNVYGASSPVPQVPQSPIHLFNDQQQQHNPQLGRQLFSEFYNPQSGIFSLSTAAAALDLHGFNGPVQSTHAFHANNYGYDRQFLSYQGTPTMGTASLSLGLGLGPPPGATGNNQAASFGGMDQYVDFGTNALDLATGSNNSNTINSNYSSNGLGGSMLGLVEEPASMTVDANAGRSYGLQMSPSQAPRQQPQPQPQPPTQQQQQQQQAGQAVFSGRVMSSGGVGVGIPPSFTQFGPTSTSNHQHSASGELFAGAASGNTSSNSGSSAATRSDVGRKRASWGGQR